MSDSEWITDLRRPCTPPHPRKSAPPGTPGGARRVEPRDFPGTPGSRGRASSVLTHPFQWARSGPRRPTTIWGTWPPNASSQFGITHLARPRRTGPGAPDHLDGQDSGGLRREHSPLAVTLALRARVLLRGAGRFRERQVGDAANHREVHGEL